MKKKIVSKKNFLSILAANARSMNKNKNIFNKATKLLELSDKYMFIHQNKYFGEPSINLGDDLMRIQEAIYLTKPDYVIEVGTCWGGTTLFLSNVLEGIGHGKVIGIDIFIPSTMRKRIMNKGKLSKRIKLYQESSTSINIKQKLDKILRKKKCLIILDSDHTEKNVLDELEFYANYTSKNSYIIVCDTILNFIKPNKKRIRPWNKTNNPYTALQKFLKKNKSFKLDKNINSRLLLSCNYFGFLKRVK